MFFGFNIYSGLLLPFFLQGVIVAAVLWARRRREDTAADGWLALLLLLFAVRLAQWMLGFAGWYDSHDARTTFMFYWPFSNWLAVGPALYFYFRSLTNQEFWLERRHWWHFAPALALGAWLLVVFSYDIGWWHGLQGQPLPAHFGTKGPLASWADYQPIGLLADTLGYLSVLAYAVHSFGSGGCATCWWPWWWAPASRWCSGWSTSSSHPSTTCRAGTTTCSPAC
jgi:hypothetical protein